MWTGFIQVLQAFVKVLPVLVWVRFGEQVVLRAVQTKGLKSAKVCMPRHPQNLVRR